MCELLKNYTRGNCAENGGVDELIVYNLENRSTYTLEADGLSIATITMALEAGCRIEESAYLANYAGGMVCEVAGIIPIELDNLFNKIYSEHK